MTAVYIGEVDDVMGTEVCRGNFQLVYLNPQALLTNPTWRYMLLGSVYQSELVAQIVEEVHCVKKL